MKHFFLFIFLLFTFSSCDDGDIIVTTFDFDNITLEYCQSANSIVFYKVNNANLESLSFNLQTQNEILTTPGTQNFQIDAINNVVHYRTYNTDVPANYFCSSIPPSSPEILNDFVSSQGVVTIHTKIVETVTSGTGFEHDASFVYRTSIILSNIRLETQNETITQETLELGFIDVTE